MTPFIIENYSSQMSILELFFVIIFGYILYLIYFFYTNQIKAHQKNIFSMFACCNCFILYNKWIEISAFIIFIRRYSCTKCKEKCMIFEIVLAVTFVPLVLVYFIYLNKIEFLFFSVLQIFIFSIAQIDFKMMIINLKSIFFIMILGLLYKITNFNLELLLFKDILLGFVVGWSLIYSISYLYKIIRREEGFGSGDKWLLGSLGIWFGYFDIVFIFFHSCVFASAYIFISKIYKNDLSQKIPIGSFFCLTAILYIFK